MAKDAPHYRLFDEFQHEAFRLETLPAYDVPGDAESEDRYAAGELFPDPPQPSRWTNEIRDWVASGKRMPHVRLITEPLTMYLRGCMDWYYPHQVEAGRELFILSPGSELADEARKSGDYWMFDSATVALMRYDDRGDILGSDLASADDVPSYVEFRDRLIDGSVPFREWLAGWRQRVR